MQISYITAEMNEDFTRAVEVGARTDVEVVSLRSPVWDCDLEHLERDDIRRVLDVLNAQGMQLTAELALLLHPQSRVLRRELGT